MPKQYSYNIQEHLKNRVTLLNSTHSEPKDLQTEIMATWEEYKKTTPVMKIK